jgi:hypothetical protein
LNAYPPGLVEAQPPFIEKITCWKARRNIRRSAALSWFIFYRPGSDEFQAAWQAVVNTPRLLLHFIIDRAALFTCRLQGSDYVIREIPYRVFVLLFAESNRPLIRQRALTCMQISNPASKDERKHG